MRDPRRIPTILKKLELVWLNNTDLRLGQLISNLTTEVTRHDNDPVLGANDVYYVEDEELEALLERALRNLS